MNCLVSTPKMNRRVRREVKGLIRDVRRLLRQSRDVSARGERKRMGESVQALEKAWQDNDQCAMRAGLVELEELAQEHLSGARKSVFREYSESIVVAVVIAFVLRAFVVEAFQIPSGSMLPTMEIGDHIFVNKLVYGLRIPGTRVKFLDYRQPRRGEVIVFMNPCTPDKDFIKRVVAVPGDTVEVRCRQLYVNGQKVATESLESEPCQLWDLDPRTGNWMSESCIKRQETVVGKSYQVVHESSKVHPNAYDFPLPGQRELLCKPEDGVRSAQDREAARGKFVQTQPPAKMGQCEPWYHYVVPDEHVFVMGDYRSNSSDSRFWGAVPLNHVKGKALFVFWSHKAGKPTGILWSRLGMLVH